VSDDSEWYWDLDRQRAVPARERGPATRVLGPYASRHEAEHWRSLVEARNESWDEQDDDWNRDPDDETAGR
jgi:hypothetical protein